MFTNKIQVFFFCDSSLIVMNCILVLSVMVPVFRSLRNLVFPLCVVYVIICLHRFG